MKDKNYSLKSNDEFIFEKNYYGFECHIKRAKATSELRGCMAEINDCLNNASIVKDEKYVKAGIFELEDHGRLFIKKYRENSIGIKNFFSSCKPIRMWKASILLEKEKISVPSPQAVMIGKSCFSRKDSYLITDAVNDISSDDFYINAITEPELRINFFNKLSNLMVSIHKAGIYHGDCKLSNFFILGEANNCTIGILDLDGATIHNSVKKTHILKDVGRFIAAVSEFSATRKCIDIKNELITIFSSSYNDNMSIHLNKKKLKKIISSHLTRKGFANE